jgi:hypothetical protein
MNYDAEIAKLVDTYAEKLSKLTGKPEHRKLAARKLLLELTEATKKLTREKTLNFYEGKSNGKSAEAAGPLFQTPVVQGPVRVPPPLPGTPPPVVGSQPTSLPLS